MCNEENIKMKVESYRLLFLLYISASIKNLSCPHLLEYYEALIPSL